MVVGEYRVDGVAAVHALLGAATHPAPCTVPGELEAWWAEQGVSTDAHSGAESSDGEAEDAAAAELAPATLRREFLAPGEPPFAGETPCRCGRFTTACLEALALEWRGNGSGAGGGPGDAGEPGGAAGQERSRSLCACFAVGPGEVDAWYAEQAARAAGDLLAGDLLRSEAWNHGSKLRLERTVCIEAQYRRRVRSAPSER